MPTIEDLATELAALRRRVDASESVLAIHELKARYGDLVDGRFARGRMVDDDRLAEVATAVAALFTEDGIWDGGPGLGSVQGRDAIAARLRTPTLSFSRHLFTSPRIEVDGDRASSALEPSVPLHPTRRHGVLDVRVRGRHLRAGRWCVAPRFDAADHRVLRPGRARMGPGVRLNTWGARCSREIGVCPMHTVDA